MDASFPQRGSVSDAGSPSGEASRRTCAGGERHVVFAGAGHAALGALRDLAKRPLEGATLTVISRSTEAHYSGLLPGWVEGLYDDEALAVDLTPLLSAAGARLIIGDVAAAEENAFTLSDGQRVPFDMAVVNTGSDTRLPGPLTHPRVIRSRPVARFVAEAGPQLDAAASFAVVGAGVAGAEIALALATRRRDATVTLIEARTLLPGTPGAFRRRVRNALARRGVVLHEGREVVHVGEDTVRLANGVEVPGACVMALTGAAPPAWLDRSPFRRSDDGFLATDGRLRSLSHPHIFSAGDVATMADDPRPKAGVFAVRAGPKVARALRALVAGEPPPPARLQRRALVLLSAGGRNAIGTRNGLTVEGRFVWRMKDHLDRTFVERHRTGP